MTDSDHESRRGSPRERHGHGGDDAANRPSSPFGDVAARFKALHAAPEFDAALAARPSGPSVGATHAFRSVIGLVFAGIAVGMGFGLQSMLSGRNGMFATVFIAVLAIFCLIGVAMAVWSIWRMIRWWKAPTTALPALVVDRRTEVTAGGRRRRTRTAYYVTLEHERDGRREYDCPDSLHGQAVDGEMGVAYVRDGVFVGFRRFAV